jgi:hypothetical protein
LQEGSLTRSQMWFWNKKWNSSPIACLQCSTSNEIRIISLSLLVHQLAACAIQAQSPYCSNGCFNWFDNLMALNLAIVVEILQYELANQPPKSIIKSMVKLWKKIVCQGLMLWKALETLGWSCKSYGKLFLKKKLKIEKIFVDVEELSKVIDMNENLLIKHCDW